MLYLTQIPRCCGAAIITDFFPEWDYKTKSYTSLKENVETYLGILDLKARTEEYGIIQAFLNGEQTRYLHDTMIKHGFTLVVNGAPNPKHSSHLFMYVKTYGTEKPVKVTKGE